MTIASLRLTNFRNFATAELFPCTQGLNIICGANGSGKSSLLESIFYLGLGRSFRSTTPSRLIRHQTEQFSIFSQIISEQREIPVGVERELDGSGRLRIAEKNACSIAELASCLPIQIIHSQTHQLFESGPLFRRKFMDWGLFYQSDSFLSCWRQYERVLKQRNSVLRERRPKPELNPWTEKLVEYGLELDNLRKQYVKEFSLTVPDIAKELLGEVGVLEFQYESGFESDQSDDFVSQLEKIWPEEMQCKHTLLGPHRADLVVTVDGISVKHFLSRGQQKLLICAMIIAQGCLLNRHAEKSLIYLVDDLPAELDLMSRQKLISLLSRQKTQIFITAIEYESICNLLKASPDVPVKVFHVEHGNVRIDSPLYD